MQRTILAALAVSVGLVLWPQFEAIAAEETRIGKTIGDFTLRDYRGAEHSLSDFGDSKLVVVAFLGTECPLVKLYAPRLEEMANRLAAEGVAFVGINSNRQDSHTKVASYARQHGITFPVLKDASNEIADRFGAVRTPEVFVLDADRVVRYWGRIDDQYGVGIQRKEPTRQDLAVAIDELLAGREVSEPVTQAPGCFIGRIARVAPHGEVTYSNQIVRILEKRCVECHRTGEIAPFPLRTYEDVAGWAEMIREVVEGGRMPPWFANPEYGHFANDARLTEEEKQLINQWVDNGAPEGDPADMPELRQFAEGWQIPQPDAVYYISDEPVSIPAEGTVEYQNFTVDPGFTEDKWVVAAEARPGNRAVVHHIIVFITDANGDGGPASTRQRGAIIGYAPGMQARMLPEGVGIHVPAGAKLSFQMHYTSCGSEQQDRSYVGLVFGDASKIRQELRGGVVGNLNVDIPAGAENHEMKARYRFRKDMIVTSLLPHMHLRGKSFRFEADYPDGTHEVLLDVPRYDFNWQLWYEFATPKLIPKGTVVRCTAHYDNSADNLMNPDPTINVHWGEQTWEEMMFGFYTGLDPAQDLTKRPDSDEVATESGG